VGAAKGRGSSKSGLSSEDESGQEEVGLNLSSQGKRVDRRGRSLYRFTLEESGQEGVGLYTGSQWTRVDRRRSHFTWVHSGPEWTGWVGLNTVS
jgi:hypothetical protein